MNKQGIAATLVVVLLAAGTGVCVAGCGPSRPVVRKVDHVAISSEDPKALFDLMTGSLGLPVAWAYSEYPGFSTGGVQAGNVNLELLRFGPAVNTATPRAMLWGIVLEPYPLAQSVPALEKRGAKPGKEEVQTRQEGGREVPAWTNVTLEALGSRGYTVYLCEYVPAVKEAMSGHQASGAQGLLGLESVRRVVLSSKDADGLRALWSKTMAPDKMSREGVLKMGEGPEIEVQAGADDVIASLVFEVSSLAEARAALERLGLLGSASPDRLTVDPAKVQGLDLQFVEK